MEQSISLWLQTTLSLVSSCVTCQRSLAGSGPFLTTWAAVALSVAVSQSCVPCDRQHPHCPPGAPRGWFPQLYPVKAIGGAGGEVAREEMQSSTKLALGEGKSLNSDKPDFQMQMFISVCVSSATSKSNAITSIMNPLCQLLVSSPACRCLY